MHMRGGMNRGRALCSQMDNLDSSVVLIDIVVVVADNSVRYSCTDPGLSFPFFWGTRCLGASHHHLRIPLGLLPLGLTSLDGCKDYDDK